MMDSLAEEHEKLTDDADFGAMLTMQNRALSRYSEYLAAGKADAEDLLQDTLLRCWTARHTFQQGTSIIAWSKTVMRNRFISGIRKDRPTVELAEEAMDPMLSVSPSQEAVVALQDIYWALDELLPDHRDAVLLASEGFSMEESARNLGISSGAFKSRLMRGRIRLRSLNDDCNTPLLSPAGRKRAYTRSAKSQSVAGTIEKS